MPQLESPHPSQPAEQPRSGLSIFVGAILAFALLKEIFSRLTDNPLAVRAKSFSRPDAAFTGAVMFRMLKTIGATVLGARPGVG